MKQFWMVQGSGTSFVRHDSKEKAEREATRLAAQDPGVKFYVMEAISGHRKIGVEKVDFRNPDSSARKVELF